MRAIYNFKTFESQNCAPISEKNENFPTGKVEFWFTLPVNLIF